MTTLTSLLLLNHGVSVDITGNDGRRTLKAAACNGHLEGNRQLLSNFCYVHIARKFDLTTLLAAADSGHVEVFRQFLKHSACVVFAIEKCS
jgi:ankyrin repeat protein